FHSQITTVLCGIAVGQGVDWPPIRELLDAEVPAAPQGAPRRRRTATR
ncbi:MAG: hypothetical protein JWM05_1484, partial [Acidimicrobiales bacterium]|nr:hypothetical protein [Acidimicrobiales bacterium]